MASSKNQLPALTGMRCLLALWIVIYHQLPHNPEVRIPWLGGPDALHCILRTGYIAVTVFFVLSGFVLAYNYELGNRWSLPEIRRFAVARFARIYPAYCLGLVLLIPFSAYRIVRTLSPGTLAAEGGIAILNWTLLQSWIPKLSQTWNFPGWSLSDEAFFYACFPFLGVALWKCSRLRSLIPCAFGLWVLSLTVPLWSVLLPIAGFGDLPAALPMHNLDVEVPANLIRYNPLLRLPEFGFGILLGRSFTLVQASKPAWFGRGHWFYVPGAIALCGVLAWSDVIPYPLVHNGLLLPLYGCILFGLALSGGTLARGLSKPTMVFWGNASYAMYILHAPIDYYMKAVWKHLLGLEPGTAYVLGYLMMVVLASYLVFRYVEVPLNRYLRERLSKGKVKVMEGQVVRSLAKTAGMG